MGRLITVVIVVATSTAHAEPDAPRVLPAPGKTPAQQVLENDQARLVREHEQFLEKQQEHTSAEEMAGLEKDTYAAHREELASHRHRGYALIAVGSVIGVGAGVAGYLGATVNHDIQRGSLATAGDISQAADTGQAYNVAAWSCLGVGSLLVAIGTATVLLNLDPGDITISPTATGDAKGFMLSGRF